MIHRGGLAVRLGRLVSLALLPFCPEAGAEPVVVKMATLAPDGSRWHLVLKEMAEAWKAASGGQVVLRLFPGGVAGDDPDVVRKMRQGTLDGAVLTTVGVAELDPSVYALGLPLAYDSAEEAYFVLEKMRPRLEAGLEAKGFVVLNWVDGGFTRFFAKEPVASPDQLKAQKLFTWPGDAESVRLWTSAGFDPVPLAAPELGGALANGAVTAAGIPPQVAVVAQFYTKARNMTDLPWQFLLGGTLVSRTAWDRIPGALGSKLREAARQAEAKLRDEVRAAEARDVEEMRKRGLRIVAVDARAREQWRKAAEALRAGLRGTMVPAEACDEALRWRDEYRRGRARAR